MTNYNLASDLMTPDPSTVKRNKKKINELLDKYGSREAILQSADLADSINYDFAHGDDLIDEVLRERAAAQNLLQNPLLQTNQAALAREARAVRIAYHHNEDKADTAHAIKSADNEYAGTKSDATVAAENNRKTELTALTKAKEKGIYKDSSKFNKLVDSVFQDEGGYEDNPKKIDQPTNMGIIQSTLDNFNKAHPDLKIDKKLKDITREDAQLIYKLDFYDQYRLNEINNPIIAKTIFHMFVNGRPNDTAQIIQKNINSLGKKIDIDGTLGSITINAINQLNKEGKSHEFNKKLIELRLELENKLRDHNKFPGRRKRFEKLLKE